jgi:hypothetical protein
MASREEGRRRIRTATYGLAAASLVGTAAIAVTVAVQASTSATPAPANDSTDNGTSQDQGGTGFIPPDGGLTNGGSTQGGTDGGGTQGRTNVLPHARSGGSR